MGVRLTEEQRAVVENRGGTLLVSAAAGSGKTRVLVERLLDRVEREGLDVDRFLIITYTNAAAAELRARIVEEIGQRLAGRPEDGHLRRQSTLVYKAQISTIHAFCAQLLREQGHLLDINPDFRLLDESEAVLIMGEVLTDVLEKRYETIAPGDDFTQLVDTMSAGRDDSRLAQIVLHIRNKVQSHPRPERWLARQEAAFALEGISEAGETAWGRLLLEDAARQAGYWLGQMTRALDLCACDEAVERNYAPSLCATIAGLQALLAGTKQGWDQTRAALPIPFPTPGRKSAPADLPEFLQIKELRARCKKRMEKLAEGFADPSQALLEDLAAVRPAVRGLFALVTDFEAAYQAEKQRRGVLDFSDLEHMAVALLVDREGPTPLAEQLSVRFDEIMVDEYQDTNEVQNAIFSALSQRGRNLFLVGDVKQSIYRFRLADPTIFLEKYRRFRPAAEAGEGEARRMILSKNFRSQEQILEGANFLFRNLMSKELGEMDYRAEEALYTGGTLPWREACAVELDALDLSEDGDEGEAQPEEQAAKVSKDLQEARSAARRIRQLLDEGFPVSDGAGGLRPVRSGDIVILMRSPGGVLHHYARALGERGIPWEAEGSGDFFDATEVQVALSLLQIIDNPRQDVPLISVLRSPVYGFSADALSLLRAGCPEGDFYDALAAGAAAGDGDSAAFLAELEELRFGTVDRSCYQLIWHLYDRTSLMGIFGAMADGETRQANLLLLSELARKFEGAGHRGLFGFLSYLTRLREQGKRIAPPSTGSGGEGVRILTIHRSKGLEFPVVLLCGLSRRLNREDTMRPILFHPKLGVGPKRLDTERMVEYPTLARQAVARQVEYEMMAEELRLLYVAVTRAKEKLILSVALTGGGRDVAKLVSDAGCPVEPQALAGCQTVGQWVLLAVLARPEAHPLLTAAGAEALPPVGAQFGPPWDIRWVKGAALSQPPLERRVEEPGEEESPADPELAARLSWTYPHSGDVELPSKLTATQLKGRNLDDEVAEDTYPAAAGAVPQETRPTLRRPRFAEEEFGLTPAQKGTALHLVMQFIDFQQTGSAAQVSREVERLVRSAFLTPEQGKAVDVKRIAAFFASPLGREVRQSPTLRREFKFSILTPAADYWPGAGAGEQVLLQGVVDCFFETLEGITVVDFKTDQVRRENLAARAAEYRPQLMAYGRALEEITGRPVVRRVLWFFAQNAGIEV